MLTQRRAVKQRRMVLDVTTALEPNLTFFTAVELADVLDMDIKIEVVPRGALAGIARPDERRGAAGSGGTGIAPVASRDARRGKARRRSGAGSASRTYGPTGGPWVARVTMASNRRRYFRCMRPGTDGHPVVGRGKRSLGVIPEEVRTRSGTPWTTRVIQPARTELEPRR